MSENVGSRTLIALSLSETEFLVKSSGSQSEVQTCLQGMLPTSKFTLNSLNETNAAAAQKRLKKPQVELLERFRTEAASPLNTFQVQFTTPPPLRSAETAGQTKDAKAPAKGKKGDELNDRELEKVAGGLYYSSSLFDPQISLVSRPLIGGAGPVAVTVGVGIAGKF